MLPPSAEIETARRRSRSFAPSWVDGLQRAVEWLPWPGWATYAALCAALGALVTALKWSAGTYPPGTVYPYHLVVFGTGIFGFALMHYLDRAAGTALEAMRPALTLTDNELAGVRYRLTTMPASGAAVATLLGVGFGVFQRFVILPSRLEAFKYASSGGLFYVESAVVLLFDWSVIGAFVYHAVRQLHLIDGLYRRHAAIHLFHTRPLYAFSRFSAQHAVGIAAAGYAWLAAYPPDAGPEATRLLLSSLAVLVALAVAAFLGPLWGAHQRLVQERERRIHDTHRKIEAVVARLHDGVSADDYAAMDGITKAITGLAAELALLEKARTWPWQTNTLRGFLTAVLLPLLLWGVQQALMRTLLS
jgi:hypothetical protein